MKTKNSLTKKALMLMLFLAGTLTVFGQNCKWNEDHIDKYEACLKQLHTAYESMADDTSKHPKTNMDRNEMYNELVKGYSKLMEVKGEDSYEDEEMYENKLNALKKYHKNPAAKKSNNKNVSKAKSSKATSASTKKKNNQIKKETTKKKDTTNNNRL